MKRCYFPVCLFLFMPLFGQNLQLHYDFGEQRHFLTSTLEMFKPDDFGATFWFVDIDYDSPTHTASMAYWEIARYIALPIWKNRPLLSQVSATVQYNDGLNSSFSFGSVWLGGISLPISQKIVTVNADFLYRQAENQDANFQLTFVWFRPLLDNKLVLTGFVDIWSQENFDGDDDGTEAQIVVLTEPQFWLNITDHLALGSEIEISRNFIPGGSAWKWMPTVGLKWNF